MHPLRSRSILAALLLPGLAAWAAHPVLIRNDSNQAWTLVSHPRSTRLITTLNPGSPQAAAKVWELPDLTALNAIKATGTESKAQAEAKRKAYLADFMLVLNIPAKSAASIEIAADDEFCSEGFKLVDHLGREDGVSSSTFSQGALTYHVESGPGGATQPRLEWNPMAPRVARLDPANPSQVTLTADSLEGFKHRPFLHPAAPPAATESKAR